MHVQDCFPSPLHHFIPPLIITSIEDWYIPIYLGNEESAVSMNNRLARFGG